MTDSSRGFPPPGSGFRGAPDRPPGMPGHPPQRSEAGGPARLDGDLADASQTRPMPIVPDTPDRGGPGGDDAGRRGPAPWDHASPPDPSGRPGRPDDPGGSGPPAPPSGRRARARAGGAEQEKEQRKAAGKQRAGRDLGAAIGVGLALGALIVVSLFVYKAAFVVVVAGAVCVGLWELTTRLAERKDIRVPLVPLAVGGAAMIFAGYARGAEGAWVAMAMTALAVLVWRMTDAPDQYLRDVTAAVFVAFYVPFLATFVALMLAADDGPQRVMTFLVLTVVSDTGAYAVGWRFGTHKLAPRISPGKTREGLFGAIGFAMVAGALCMQFAVDGGVWWQGIVLGLAVAVSATLGDLGESMIKRDLGIKDMGTLLPGHGGIMDRLDSLLPTAPVAWLLLVAFVGSG
ncbi:phosphatidate cytidylyltransferase [Streptomyces phytohabitans]|uniref:phosphatidate cytidylyltransferase n=1 Tax=Streptomyces phytohabitans TaxID=1150371 RepID=UPI00345C1757